VKQRGHPIRGAIAGLFLGLFVSLDLVIFGVFALDADALVLFPVLGLIAGVALGVLAPLHHRSAERQGKSSARKVIDPEPGPSAA
jgi:hypothetical protein